MSIFKYKDSNVSENDDFVELKKSGSYDLFDKNGNKFETFIDTISYENDKVFIIGWSLSKNIKINHKELGIAEITRHKRPDVCEILGLSQDNLCGFCGIINSFSKNFSSNFEVSIPFGSILSTGQLGRSEISEFQRENILFFAENVVKNIKSLERGSDEWIASLSNLPVSKDVPDNSCGYIEGILKTPENGAVVFGWFLHSPESIIWFEDDLGNIYQFENFFRRHRKDIVEAFPNNPWREGNSAFIIHIPLLAKGVKSLRLKILCDFGSAVIAESDNFGDIPLSPKEAAAKLFSIDTEESLFHERIKNIDLPILEKIISKNNKYCNSIAPKKYVFGEELKYPSVSIIIPVYKRVDFFEHQIIEFSKDKYIRENCEIIYVLDEKDNESIFLNLADRYHKLFGVSFIIILGKINRGFSGANNIGADFARGREFLFLNSDVIPQYAGWLESLRTTLAAEEVIGIVGARLLFATGGLQHAGMAFEWHSNYNIWINRHPFAGLSPELDPATEATDMPAVTGACMLMRSSTFHEVGGWDTGYLIGDFEDSDLCLAVRRAGYRVVYQPLVQLTHLERQSFTAIGHDHFRQRVVIANAVRHQTRWCDVLENAASQHDDIFFQEDRA